MIEGDKLNWLETLGEFSSKGHSLQYNKDFYDMLGIINLVIPAGDAKNENYKVLISELQEDHLDENLYCETEKYGKVFLSAINTIGQSDADYNKVRPRFENFITYKNIREDEEMLWKNFMDKLNIEYRIEEYAFCWWTDDLIPNYKCIWANEEQLKAIENSKKYIAALKELHDNIERHLIVKKSANESLDEKKRRKKAFDSGMKKLDNLIGLSGIKSALKERIAYVSLIERAKQLGIKLENEASNHLIFTGNPGTGKTVVARILGEIYYGLGVLKTNAFIETNKTELIGAYIGHTEKNVERIFSNVINVGGMIFIDEFHQLCDGPDSKGFGNKAIQSIVPYLENYRDEFVLVAAGYPEEMARALNHDPGLEQRFSTKINFPDYSKLEVFEIFKSFTQKNNMSIDKQNGKMILDMFEKLPEGGNGRMARDIYEHTLLKKALRMFEMGNISDEQFKKEYNIISAEDVNKSIETVGSKYNKKSETKRIGFSF